jgi:hypothetical protein
MFDKQRSGELRQGDKATDPPLPCTPNRMNGHHAGQSSSSNKTLSIASMCQGRPRTPLSQTVSTNFLIPEQKAIGTHEAVVMQRLDYAATLGVSSIVNRRRETRKEIMYMYHVRAKATNPIPHPIAHLGRVCKMRGCVDPVSYSSYGVICYFEYVDGDIEEA